MAMLVLGEFCHSVQCIEKEKVNTGKSEPRVREENSEGLLKKEDKISFRQSGGALYTSVKGKCPWYLIQWRKFPALILSFQFLFRVLYPYSLCSFWERAGCNLFLFPKALDDCCWLVCSAVQI